MIDIKRTTLVPSLRALTAFKSQGQLDPLVLEYTVERAAVAAAIERPASEVIVDLSPGAMAATAQELLQAHSAPAVSRRLLHEHAIHPAPNAAAIYRTLADGATGLDRRDSSLWLWFATPLVHDAITGFLGNRSIPFSHPLVYDWPVTDALAVNVPPTKALLRALNEELAIVDVDHNGRPFPETPVGRGRRRGRA